MTSLLDIALRAAANGLHVFPCQPNGKTPIDTGRGALKWSDAATTNPRIITEWWSAVPAANIGVACAHSGLLVVDCDLGINKDPQRKNLPSFLRVDGVSSGEDAFYVLATEHLGVDFPWNTLTVQTRSGGFHYYFRNPGVKMTNRSPIPSWIDVRANGGPLGGGYVLAPGSVIDGRHYKVQVSAPILTAPPWLVELCRDKPRPQQPRPAAANGPFRQPAAGGSHRGLIDTVKYASEGNRNQALHWAACSMAKDGVPITEAINQLADAAQHAGLDYRETETTIRSGYRTVGA